MPISSSSYMDKNINSPARQQLSAAHTLLSQKAELRSYLNTGSFLRSLPLVPNFVPPVHHSF